MVVEPITAVGLACNIVNAFKDVYALGKAIYKFADSVAHHEAERKESTEEWYLALLKLQSFGRWFERSKGLITDDPDLDAVSQKNATIFRFFTPD
jgi:hypothetical protein